MSYTDDQDTRDKPQAMKLVGAGIFLLAVIGLIWGIFYMTSSKEPKPNPVATAQPTPPPEPPIEYEQIEEPPPPDEDPVPEPIPPEPAPEPEAPKVELPPLNNSDSVVRKAVQALAPGPALVDMLVSEEIVRKFVLAINNISKGELARKYPPISPPKQKFIAREQGQNHYTMASESYSRYDSYTDILSSLNTDVMHTLYSQYYPLLDEAHRELGETKESFHAVLLKAIDHILKAPIIEGDLELVRPSVMYKFADPELENLSAAHKLMLRMGPQNARKVKQSLRELRKSLSN